MSQQTFHFTLDSAVNVASVSQRSPFRYPGGKTWLVPHIYRWLHSLPTRPGLFIEPFAGGAITGLTVAFEELAQRVLLVELDPDVAAVWDVILSDQGENLARRILSFEMTLQNVKEVLGSKPRDLEDRAFITLLRNRVQHGGILAPGASLMKEGEKGRGVGSRWYPRTLATRIREIVRIRHRIECHNADAFGFIRQHAADPRAAFFVDPPYTMAGRRLYKFSELDHAALFREMAATAGNFLMTYDDTEEVRGWAKENGFDFERVAMKSRQHTAKRELLIGRSLAWARRS
jgi:DNA adenine methylase